MMRDHVQMHVKMCSPTLVLLSSIDLLIHALKLL